MASELADQADQLIQANVARWNIYVGANPRPTKGKRGDACIELARTILTDIEHIDADEAKARIAAAGLPAPTLLLNSGHGVHAYWRLAEPMTDLAAWREIQKDLADLLHADPKVINPERVMRLPGFANHKPPVAQCEMVEAAPERIYYLASLRKIIPRMESRKAASAQAGDSDEITEGHRNATLTSLAGAMRRKGMGEAEIYAALAAVNLNRCKPPLDDGEVRSIARNVCRYPAGEAKQTQRPPDRLAEAAFHGLAGEIVRKIEPHTEADPAALLTHLLGSFGSIIGRSAHFYAGGQRHYGNLFAALVGNSAKGRKGTASANVNFVIGQIAPDWLDERQQSGMSSGEGLIWAVRDKIIQQQPIRQRGEVTGYQDVEIDPGISDKRLMVIEGELGQPLKVMSREGNTLSPIIRKAWDSDGRLQSLTKNSPAKATGAHISIIGHITLTELRQLLAGTSELFNGWANRFLWVYTRRRKLLPDGGQLHAVDLTGEKKRLTAAIEHGKQDLLIARDREAADLWERLYPELEVDHPGIFGAVTARSSAQVLRLAMIYALLDCEAWVRPVHLQAAVAVWRYCEVSAAYIFTNGGEQAADPLAGLAAWIERRGGRVTVRDLVRYLHRYKGKAGQAEADLQMLIDAGRGRWEWTDPQETGGRQSKAFILTTDTTDTDKTPDHDTENEPFVGVGAVGGDTDRAEGGAK
ncbi:MAG: DUF3987 domain-containing protein [Phycisphaerales bacterium]|nr:DUF3987 domain-containing protein [Phycisphaerales bacterium]